MPQSDSSTPTRVSIITPSFNQGTFLRATLQSVADQDYPAIEHIVMDGGSTDGSVAILREWDAHPITWRSAPDGGQAAAIQAGVEMATGEVIAWLNSDDIYLDSGAVAAVMAVMASGAGIVTAAGRYIDAYGRPLHRIPVRADRLRPSQIRHADHLLQPATFVRRDLMAICPLDATLHWAMDWDLFIRLADITTIVALDREVAGYRIHSTGKTVTGHAARKRELLRVVRRYHRRSSLAYVGGWLTMQATALSERLPSFPARAVRRIVGIMIDVSDRVTRGHGVQA